MNTIAPFEQFYKEYDEWFIKNKWAYESEIAAIRQVLPVDGLGIEVGVGSGRFAGPLGIEIGIDPSIKMIRISRSKGIQVIRGVGERIPFRDEIFEVVLIVTTICFVDNPLLVLKESKRILKKGGLLIIGFIDRDSALGQIYEARKETSKFYGVAKFYTVEEVKKWVQELGMSMAKTYQTLFRPLAKIYTIEPCKDGFGEGAFVAMSIKKNS
jgi:SAM-dependent methyltransferase